jgi:hypothetical protein
MRYQTALPLLALTLSAACDAGSATRSLRSETAALSRAPAATEDRGSPRSGALTVRKECHTYVGQAGGICTITESSLDAIEVQSTITYAQPAVNGILDSDVTLDPPGPGNNAANGHCMVDLTTGFGSCTFSGGTGKFQHFQAAVQVSPLGWPFFAWHGTYSYGK